MAKRKVVQVPQHIELRAMDIEQIAKECELTPEQKKWCEIVKANNAPGQRLQVDPAIIEALRNQGNTGEPPADEDVQG